MSTFFCLCSLNAFFTVLNKKSHWVRVDFLTDHYHLLTCPSLRIIATAFITSRFVDQLIERIGRTMYYNALLKNVLNKKQ